MYYYVFSVFKDAGFTSILIYREGPCVGTSASCNMKWHSLDCILEVKSNRATLDVVVSLSRGLSSLSSAPRLCCLTLEMEKYSAAAKGR